MLKKFLDSSENKPGVFDEGSRLSIDRRRYLNLPAVAKIMGGLAPAVQLIDDLLPKGIILRGLILKCQFCKNADWFPLSQVSQEFDCRRCGRRQHMVQKNWFGADANAYEPSLYYKLDEIVFQGLRNDMDSPLLTLAEIQRRSQESFLFTPEMWFYKEADPKPWIEADILCIADGILVIGEVKSNNSLGATLSEEKSSLVKYRELAEALGARRVVFATASTKWSSGTEAAISHVFGNSGLEILILTAADLLVALF